MAVKESVRQWVGEIDRELEEEEEEEEDSEGEDGEDEESDVEDLAAEPFVVSKRNRKAPVRLIEERLAVTHGGASCYDVA